MDRLRYCLGFILLSAYLCGCATVHPVKHELQETEYKKSAHVALLSITCEKEIHSELKNGYVDDTGVVLAGSSVLESEPILEKIREHVFWMFSGVRPYWLMEERDVFSTLGYHVAKNELALEREAEDTRVPLQGYAGVGVDNEGRFNKLLEKIPNADSGMLLHVTFNVVNASLQPAGKINQARVAADLMLYVRNKQGREIVYNRIPGVSDNAFYVIGHEKMNVTTIRALSLEAVRNALLGMEYYLQTDQKRIRF